MNLEIKTVDQVLVAKVLDTRIDGSVIGDFRKQFEPHLQEGTSRIALDISDVKFVDSTGLGALISLRKNLPQEGELAVCGATPQVDNLFRLTRLNKVMLMFADVDMAVAELAKLG